jgi:hypothetical protein
MHAQKVVFSTASAPAGLTAEAFAKLLRRAEVTNEVGSYLETINVDTAIPGTKTKIRWHRIAHDGTHNKPDVEKLVGKLIKLLVDFACTRSEISEAHERYLKTGSSEGFAALQEKARRLFTKADRAGEVGELMLFYLAERQLGYPQVLCKMPLKTNPNVHAHGADGVHASLHPTTNHLRLHWGEAKLWADFGTALNDCCFSLQEMLLNPPEAKKTKTRDLELLRDNLDLTNPVVEAAIKQYLNPDELVSNKVEFCGLALVGFNYADYDTLCAEFTKPDVAAVSARTILWADKIKLALEKHELIGLTIDTLCVPCTSVEDIRREFKKALSV